MLDRILPADTPAAIRNGVVSATVGRTAINAAYRYAPPFIAIIGRGLDVSVAELGVALAITDACGLASPLIGRLVDRVPRRWSMVGGLVGVAAGAMLAAASTGLVWLTIALMITSLAKLVHDVSLGAWIADHVAFQRRSRVLGLTETSWALGLLVGVSAMGVITTLTSWRVAYAAAALAVVGAAVYVGRRIPNDRPMTRVTPTGQQRRRMPRASWLVVIAMIGLMSSSQTLFITFGAWLEDEHGFTAGTLAAVTFGLGALELIASSTSAARTDHWGKERSVIAGALLMVPAAVVVATLHGTLAIGLIALGVFVVAFEFGIVSTLPIGAELIPGQPGRGIGTMVAFGTFGRAAMAIPATRLYESHGITPAALLGAAAIVVTAVAMTMRLRLVAPHASP